MLNNLYGTIIDGKLKTDSALFENYKPVVYAEIPKFDQEKQYVVQAQYVGGKDNIYLGVEVKTVVQDTKPMDIIGI